MANPIGLGGGFITGRSSSGLATTAVEKATSELLICPDWAMNIEICDSLNSHNLQAKDVVKALKKRLLHKNPRVQILALTLLETMVKNCSDNLHFLVADSLLSDLVKIVKTQSDLRVREKILSLLMSWQEAFGGPGGRLPQYFYAYDELRRYGVQFPQRSPDASPIFTPPIKQTQGTVSSSSRRLDETMAADSGRLSFSTLDSMSDTMELLNEMLQALNPSDRQGARGEVIVDLVESCRSNQKKLIQMLTTTVDEGLLCRGIELNDSVQGILGKYDAIISGTYAATEEVTVAEKPSSVAAAPVVVVPIEEDEFDALARRHAKGTCDGDDGESEKLSLVQIDSAADTSSSSASTSTALVVSEAPVPARSKDQDLIDLLSLSLTTTLEEPAAPLPAQTDHLEAGRGSYVASWAAPPQPQPQPQPQAYVRPVSENFQAHAYPNQYPPPPWATTPGYFVSQGKTGTQPSGTQPSGTYGRGPGGTPVEYANSFGVQGNKEQNQKPFIPSYRLFEELNVLGNASQKVAGSSENGIVRRK